MFLIEAARTVQFGLLPVFHDNIRNAEASYRHMVIVIRHELEHSTSETALDATILDRYERAVPPTDLMQEFLIQRFRKPHVVMSYLDFFCLKFFANLGSIITDMTDRKNCDTGTLTQRAACAHRSRLHRCTPFGHYPLSSGISYAECFSIARVLRGVLDIAQLRRDHCRSNDHVVQAEGIGDIISAVMRCAVGACKTRAIQAKVYG